MSDLHKGLSSIQQKLKAPKNQRNTFGNYNYRSCEDILEAVKPLLNGFILTLNDEICLIGERYYIRATVTLSDGENSVSATAYAREGENRKGMDDSQLTGACSSYARKYALNGLFCIDDEKDADTKDNRHVEKKEEPPKKEEPQKKDAPSGTVKPITEKQLGTLHSIYGKLKDAVPIHNYCAKIIGIDKLNSTKDLTIQQASKIIDQIYKDIDKQDGNA
jgi:hypothetical protein